MSKVDIYLRAHGSAINTTDSKISIPQGISLSFYSREGEVLGGQYADQIILESMFGKRFFSPTERVLPNLAQAEAIPTDANVMRYRHGNREPIFDHVISFETSPKDTYLIPGIFFHYPTLKEKRFAIFANCVNTVTEKLRASFRNNNGGLGIDEWQSIDYFFLKNDFAHTGFLTESCDQLQPKDNQIKLSKLIYWAKNLAPEVHIHFTACRHIKGRGENPLVTIQEGRFSQQLNLVIYLLKRQRPCTLDVIEKVMRTGEL
jgi:hypothetical protein